MLAGTHHSGRLTCGPTKLTGTEGFVNLVNMSDSSYSDRTMSIQRPSCFFNLWSSCPSRPKQHRLCRMLLTPVAGCAAAEASPPLLLPPLARTSLHSPTPPVILRRWQPHTTAEPVNPRLLSARASTAAASPAPRRPLPRPRRRPLPWCSRRGMVNVVKERLPSDVDCTWRG